MPTQTVTLLEQPLLRLQILLPLDARSFEFGAPAEFPAPKHPLVVVLRARCVARLLAQLHRSLRDEGGTEKHRFRENRVNREERESRLKARRRTDLREELPALFRVAPLAARNAIVPCRRPALVLGHHVVDCRGVLAAVLALVLVAMKDGMAAAGALSHLAVLGLLRERAWPMFLRSICVDVLMEDDHAWARQFQQLRLKVPLGHLDGECLVRGAQSNAANHARDRNGRVVRIQHQRSQSS